MPGGRVSIPSDDPGNTARPSFLPPNFIRKETYKTSYNIREYMEPILVSLCNIFYNTFGQFEKDALFIDQFEAIMCRRKNDQEQGLYQTNLPFEQFLLLIGVLDQSRLLKLDLTYGGPMNFGAVLDELAENHRLEMVIRSNVETSENLGVLKEKLSKKTFKKVYVHYNRIEGTALQDVFGEASIGPEDSLVWKTSHQNGNLLIIGHSFPPNFNGYKYGLSIRPNKKITSILIDPKTHRKIELIINGSEKKLKTEKIVYMRSANGPPRDGQVVGEEFRTVLMKDLCVMLRNQKEPISNVTLNFGNDQELFGKFQEEFLSRRDPLIITDLEMAVSNEKDIMSVLQNIGSVRNLRIKNEKQTGHVQKPIDLKKVVELAQWKNAKQVKLNTFVIQNRLEDLNLENKTFVNILVKSFSMSDLAYLKQRFFTVPHHLEFRVAFKSLDENDCQNLRFYNRDLYFAIPDSDKILQISPSHNAFIFSRIGISEVPMDVKIRPGI